MSLVVQKYGGSSVADADAIKRVARRVAETHRAGNQVVVTVSAMGDSTDDLIDLSRQVSVSEHPREMDILLTAGERISMSLLAMAVRDLGVGAQSFTGPQAGVIVGRAEQLLPRVDSDARAKHAVEVITAQAERIKRRMPF